MKAFEDSVDTQLQSYVHFDQSELAQSLRMNLVELVVDSERRPHFYGGLVPVSAHERPRVPICRSISPHNSDV